MPLSRTVFAVGVLVSLHAGALGAQGRRVLANGDPEAQLMGYYAAVMQFTPVGLPSRDGRFEFGGTGTVIPAVSLQDRIVGFGGTKAEHSNLCPVYPRLTASKGFGRYGVEVGYTPPLTVCGAKANVVALAIGRRLTLGQTWDGYLRLSAIAGSVEASTTCDSEAVANPLDLTCYGGTPSSDKIAPLAGALEFVAAYQGWRGSHLEPYVSAGIRYERIAFDVNYSRTVAQGALVSLPAMEDHNRLQANLARLHLAAGAAWDLSRRLRLGGELYYAPSALLTVRGRGAIAL
jgi:hypothetical protein